MSNIESTFTDLRAASRKGFIPFVTAGDPDFETSLAIIDTLSDLGATVIEVGVPFSDPMADGPTIQRSSHRALAAGADIRKIIEMLKRFRKTSRVPVVLFSYLNPLLSYGFDNLCAVASDAGIDGILITDVVGEEARQIGDKLNAAKVDLISLIAPTTNDERIAEISASASGFIYAVSRAGVTGARPEMTADARRLVERARQFTQLPVAVGFGISTADQIRRVWEYADAAVVGSAIVGAIESSAGVEDPVIAVERFVRRLLAEIANRPAEV